MPATPIPPLPDFAAELVARHEAPDVYRLHAIEHHGAIVAQDVPSRKPRHPHELEILFKLRDRAAQKGWAWSAVLERVREQLGLTADFLPTDSQEQHLLDNLRKRQAARAARMALA